MQRIAYVGGKYVTIHTAASTQPAVEEVSFTLPPIHHGSSTARKPALREEENRYETQLWRVDRDSIEHYRARCNESNHVNQTCRRRNRRATEPNFILKQLERIDDSVHILEVEMDWPEQEIIQAPEPWYMDDLSLNYELWDMKPEEDPLHKLFLAYLDEVEFGKRDSGRTTRAANDEAMHIVMVAVEH